MAALLSQSEREYIRGGCAADCRGDGRRTTDFRPYALQPADASSSAPSAQPLVLSNGSARYVSDRLHLLCSVKADVVRPAPTRPNEGAVELHVALDHASPSSSSRRSGGSREDRDALQDLLRDLLLDHLPLDRRRMCLVPHKSVWRLVIDVCAIWSDGSATSLLDASALVVAAALRSTLLPSVTVVEKQQQRAEQSQPEVEQTSQRFSGTSTLGLSSKGNAASAATADFELVVDGDIAQARPPPGVEDRPAPQIVTVTLLRCRDVNGDGDTAGASNKILGGVSSTLVPILDASAEEESCAHSRLHVAVRPLGNAPAPEVKVEVCALQTSGGGSIPLALLPRLVQLAAGAAPAQLAAGSSGTVPSGGCGGGSASHPPLFLPDRLQLR